MAYVINRTTCEYLKSVNTPDYDVQDWIINPDLSAVEGVPQKYWKCVGDDVVEMNQSEKDAVDAAESAAQAAARNGFILDVSFHDNQKPFADNVSAVYQTLAMFIWPGSNIVGTPKQITTIVSKNGVTDGCIKVYDVTNDMVLVEETTISGSVPHLLYLTAISNVPADRAILEVQLKRAALSAISFEF